MKHVIRSLFVSISMLILASPSRAVVILDDTWADGNRSNTSLPTNAAWYASNGGALTATTGSMTLTLGGSAVLAVSYFTTNAAAPVQLSVGDTLLTTITFLFNGVAALNSSQGFRLGVYEFGSNRVSADFSSNSSQGAGVQGYALFQNMGTTFNNVTPMTIMDRTSLSDSSLLGTTGDYTSLGTGPGNTNNFGGFVSGTVYTLQYSFQRTGSNSMSISVSWLNATNGATLLTSVTDTNATNFNFDGIGIRPSANTQAASTTIFQEVKVEYIAGSTPPSISTDPQDQQVYTNQPVSFTVLASGTLPLYYQWLYNTNTVLTNATSATLTITNAQLTDAGGYSAIVSNTYGVVTSAVAQLSVSIPDAPTIITQPQDLTVLPGDTATFTVDAGGSEPLSYQWYYNGGTLIDGATESTLTLTNVQPGAAGPYYVVIGNLAGSIASSNAILNVNTNPVGPSFVTDPASQVVLAGSTATLSASADGTAPISYQWYVNDAPILGATSPVLTLPNVQTSADGSYYVTASNSVGMATSSTAVLTVTPTVPVVNSAYNLTGFGSGTTGGGVIPTNDPGYFRVYNASDLANALDDKKGIIKVIEIMNDLDLGYNEIPSGILTNSEPFRSAETPLLHPVLLQTGVSLIDIEKKNGLTIFSANGATIRHAKLNIKSSSNIIIRNLKFDQLWEWDESTKGQYDRNDWDFITLGDGGVVSNIWVDHCTFTKAYDGIMDTKAGCSAITLSWCNYVGDDGATNPNSWVWQQINALESNRSSYAMYNFLRTNGYSTTNIVTIMQAHDKTHLAGQNDLDSGNNTITMTFHHLHLGVWDRCVPRLRAGNVHDYNLYVDDTTVLAAKRLRDSIAASMSTANQNTLNNTYSFNPPVNGTISTEDGAIMVEKSVYIDCLWPLRNNQTDPSNPEYTGKIEALDCIYHFDNTDGTTTDFQGDSTNSPGSTYFGPLQAPVIGFSWNLSGNKLPYNYYPDDPAQLQAIITDPNHGAGAGVLTWDRTNWLATSYAPTAPVIVASPQSQTVAKGQSATFTVVAGGSAPLFYQWYFNTNTPVANATSATLTVTNVQSGNVGSYFVVVSNSVSAATSTAATLAIPSSDAFSSWQQQYFGCTGCANAAPSADPYGKGISNTNQFLLGLNPTNPASVFRILSVVPQTNGDMEITWATGAGPTNVVQATGGDNNGGYSTNFTDVSGPMSIAGSGDVTNTFPDPGGATNGSSRYYRIRLGP